MPKLSDGVSPLSITYETKKFLAPGKVVASLSSTFAGLFEISCSREYVDEVICERSGQLTTMQYPSDTYEDEKSRKKKSEVVFLENRILDPGASLQALEAGEGCGWRTVSSARLTREVVAHRRGRRVASC